MAFPEFLEISQWVERPEDIRPALDEAIHADVVVIGGGFTGLSAALSLREAGVDVALVEKDFCV